MKIALPIEIANGKQIISQAFGRAQYFMFYDTGNHQSSVIENTAAILQGGAGIKAAQMVIDLHAEVLLTPQCGENAMNLFLQAKIKVMKSIGKDIKENIDMFLNDQLNSLDDVHPGFHHQT